MSGPDTGSPLSRVESGSPPPVRRSRRYDWLPRRSAKPLASAMAPRRCWSGRGRAVTGAAQGLPQRHEGGPVGESEDGESEDAAQRAAASALAAEPEASAAAVTAAAETDVEAKRWPSDPPRRRRTPQPRQTSRPRRPVRKRIPVGRQPSALPTVLTCRQRFGVWDSNGGVRDSNGQERRAHGGLALEAPQLLGRSCASRSALPAITRAQASNSRRVRLGAGLVLSTCGMTRLRSGRP